MCARPDSLFSSGVQRLKEIQQGGEEGERRAEERGQRRLKLEEGVLGAHGGMYMCSLGHSLGVHWGNYSAPAPDDTAGSPEILSQVCPRVGQVESSTIQADLPWRCIWDPHSMSWNQGPEESSAFSKSHSTLGPSQDKVKQPSVSISEFLSFIICPSQVLTRPCSHLLPCLLVSCRDTKASWDPWGLPDQRAKRWVLGRGKQLLPDIRAAGASPWGPVAGTAQEVIGGLTPAHSTGGQEAGGVRPHSAC